MNKYMGKLIAVNHSRKGQFTMEVISEDETYITGIIKSGEAYLVAADNRGEGDQITVKKKLCTIEIVEEKPKGKKKKAEGENSD